MDAPTRFMQLALLEAARGLGRTHPNPAVGCVVVRRGKVVGSGYTAPVGGPHAEVNALRAAGEASRGADLYVTLEPCDHHGRTPPCTEAILASGVKRVFIGSIDPNPLVRGKGAARLRRHGLEVSVGLLAAACDAHHERWFKYIRTGTPWVVLKAAATLDGKIATAARDSRWVTGEESRARVHLLRDQLDAVLVGVETVLADDPRLTARGSSRPGPRGELRDPVRVVLDSRARTPPAARLLAQKSLAPTLIAVTAKAPAARLRGLERAGAELLRCRSDAEGRVDLRDLLGRLGKHGLTSLLVEGGGGVHGSFLRTGLWDELLLFLAPKIAGADGRSWAGITGITAMAHALPIELLGVEQSGPDVLLRGRPRR